MDCGYSLEPPRRGGSNGYPQSMFLSRNMKNIRVFYLKIFSFLEVKFSVYLNRCVFVMTCKNIGSRRLDMSYCNRHNTVKPQLLENL